MGKLALILSLLVCLPTPGFAAESPEVCPIAADAPSTNLSHQQILDRFQQAMAHQLALPAPARMHLRMDVDLKSSSDEQTAQADLDLDFTPAGAFKTSHAATAGKGFARSGLIAFLESDQKESAANAAKIAAGQPPQGGFFESNYRFAVTGAGRVDGQAVYFLSVAPRRGAKEISQRLHGVLAISAETFLPVTLHAALDKPVWLKKPLIKAKNVTIERSYMTVACAKVVTRTDRFHASVPMFPDATIAKTYAVAPTAAAADLP